MTSPQGHRARALVWLPIVALGLCFGVGLALAGDHAPPHIDPAETALGLFAQPIRSRRVVRSDSNDLDVWLVSDASFETTGARLRRAAAVSLALPGGFKVVRATWLDPDQTWWVDAEGGDRAFRMTASRHRKGTLFVLRGLGHKADAPPWAPPYRPLPINLPHGPLRP